MNKSYAIWFSKDGTLRMTEDLFYKGGKIGSNFALQKQAGTEVTGTYDIDGWAIRFTRNGLTDRSIIFTYDFNSAKPGAPLIDFMGMTWELKGD